MSTGKYSVFIEGESIDLCVPDSRAIRDGWADWFNDVRVTTFLEQGLFPNMIEQQEQFFQTIIERKRFLVMIVEKNGTHPSGVISLSDIDHFKRSCQIALVIGDTDPKVSRNLYGLEAMAHVTEHAFKKFDINRVWARQIYPGLSKWNKRLELLGYRSEAVLEDASILDRQECDIIMISALYKHCAEIMKNRGGKLWPGKEKAIELIRKLPRRGFADLLHEKITSMKAEYFRNIEYL